MVHDNENSNDDTLQEAIEAEKTLQDAVSRLHKKRERLVAEVNQLDSLIERYPSMASEVVASAPSTRKKKSAPEEAAPTNERGIVLKVLKAAAEPMRLSAVVDAAMAVSKKIKKEDVQAVLKHLRGEGFIETAGNKSGMTYALSSAGNG